MGDCAARNCKRIANMESSSTSFSKKMKIDFGFDELTSPPLKSFQLQQGQQHHLFALSSSDQKKAISPATSSNSGGVLAGDVCSADSAVSRCSSNVSSDAVKDSFRFLDLEAKSFETESTTCISNNFRDRETTPSSEFCGDTDDMDTPAAKNTHRRNSVVAKTPPKAEIEEFFAVAERNDQKRFAEKYNYDVVKDAPLEGRYQWVRLKP